MTGIMTAIIRKPALPLLSLLCLLGWQTRATAHGVAIEYQPTQAYEINAAYDTGEPMVDAQVVVFAPDDPATPWLTGTTDATGQFLFSPSTPGNWEVQVRQAGHGDVLVIPVAEVAAASPASSSNDPNSASPNSTSPDSIGSTTFPSATSTTEEYSPLQKSLMIGAVLWGCVGTALFFARSKKG